MTAYRVVLTEEAAEDLLRIEELAIERELASAILALDVVRRLRDAVDRALRLLEFSPSSCRKAARPVNDKQCKRIAPFESAGLIAAFEVRGEVVRMGAIRPQLEQDGSPAVLAGLLSRCFDHQFPGARSGHADDGEG